MQLQGRKGVRSLIMCLTLKSVMSEDDIAFSHDNVEGIQKDVGKR